MVSPWWSKVGIRKGGRRTPQNKSEKRRKLTGNADEKRAAWLNQAALAVTHAIILSHYDSKTTPNLFQDVPICSRNRQRRSSLFGPIKAPKISKLGNLRVLRL